MVAPVPPLQLRYPCYSAVRSVFIRVLAGSARPELTA